MARQWGNKNWGEQNSFLYLFFKFPRSSEGKESACDAGDLGLIRGSGRVPGEEIATHTSILAWEIPWTKEPGGLQPRGH